MNVRMRISVGKKVIQRQQRQSKILHTMTTLKRLRGPLDVLTVIMVSDG